MDDPRLTPAIEVDSLIRRAQQADGFGAVIRKGDPQRGSIIIFVTNRGSHVACLERQLGMAGDYPWTRAGPGREAPAEEVSEWAKKRVKFDEDVWLIELDVPQPEQFIVEMGDVG